jgi:hypothetical protein
MSTWRSSFAALFQELWSRSNRWQSYFEGTETSRNRSQNLSRNRSSDPRVYLWVK